MCAPIMSGDSLVGLLHIYSRDDEAMLTAQSLQVALTATQVLGAGFNFMGGNVDSKRNSMRLFNKFNDLKSNSTIINASLK